MVAKKRYLEKYIQDDLKRKIILLTKDDKPALMIEVKWSDAERCPNFFFFEKYLASVKKIQVVKELQREKTFPDGTEIRTARNWLSDVELE